MKLQLIKARKTTTKEPKESMEVIYMEAEMNRVEKNTEK